MDYSKKLTVQKMENAECIKAIKADKGEMTVHLCKMLDLCNCNNKNCRCKTKN